MGGLGALGLAFKYPETSAIVMAPMPAMEPVLAFEDIDPAPSDSTFRKRKLEDRYR